MLTLTRNAWLIGFGIVLSLSVLLVLSDRGVLRRLEVQVRQAAVPVETPVYPDDLRSDSCPDARHKFEATVDVSSLNVKGRGRGTTKKESVEQAKRDAASKLAAHVDIIKTRAEQACQEQLFDDDGKLERAVEQALQCAQAAPAGQAECYGCEASDEAPRCVVEIPYENRDGREQPIIRVDDYRELSTRRVPVRHARRVSYASETDIHVQTVMVEVAAVRECRRSAELFEQDASPGTYGELLRQCRETSARVLTYSINATGRGPTEDDAQRAALEAAEQQLGECPGARERALSLRDFRCEYPCGGPKDISCTPSDCVTCGRFSAPRQVQYVDNQGITRLATEVVASDCFRSCICTGQCPVAGSPSPTPTY